MGYKALIDSNLRMAFNQIQDLAEDVILRKSSDNEFDFSTGAMSNNTQDLPIRAVVVKSNKMSHSHNSLKQQLMFASKGLGDLNAYDIVVINAEEWRFGPVINSDGYITYVEVYKEG